MYDHVLAISLLHRKQLLTVFLFSKFGIALFFLTKCTPICINGSSILMLRRGGNPAASVILTAKALLSLEMVFGSETEKKENLRYDFY